MKVLYMAREFPPHVYGGAGMHLAHLARSMAAIADVEVRCFGDQRSRSPDLAVTGYPYGDRFFDASPDRMIKALAALHTDLRMNVDPIDADIVHCHTWYSYFGGLLARLCYARPLVITVHSLEPLRPWKREQLGRGYDLSCWLERTALESADGVIAVSAAERQRVLELYRVDDARLRVIPNGVDTEMYRPVAGTGALTRHGIDRDAPYVLFLGRITRQKGILHFLDAVAMLPARVAAVVCAAAPDTPALRRQLAAAIDRLRAAGRQVVWIETMIAPEETVELYSHAAVFCCPSVYEPFGMTNLEAMACETAVVASNTGGIPDVVVDGETGLLVDPPPDLAAERAPATFAAALAAAIRTLLDDDGRRRAMGRRGRLRAVAHFAWDAIAARTAGLYREIAAHDAT